jgi:aspartate/methionine/tyrosine aminotransferase
MFWAHSEAVRSPWCLSQSGMPAPPRELFAGLDLAQFGHPEIEAAPKLRARLSELYGLPPERILLVPGASGGMHLAALRWFRPGSRVASETPSYEPLRALPGFCGADWRPLERRRELNWHFDLGATDRLLAGARPGHVFVTNSHNPTGARLDAAEIAALAGSAERAGGVLVCCEVYMEFAAPAKRVHAFQVAPNAVSIGSVTKAYGLGALRVGWMLLGEGLAAERDLLLDCAYLGWVDPPTPTVLAARHALEHLPELVQPILRVEREAAPILREWLAQTPGIDCVPPELGITAFPRIVGVDDTRALSRYLQQQHQVDVVPGEFFGAPGHLRIGCGVPPETLREGLRRLALGIEVFRRR